ncbi:cell death activator CIDE-A [Archocentrus centrarchus]|uniref:cell death activator CIDE-A n=1 Tax=Archocentrus centrarchus TaxID=63155 RepID=UPI0011E9D558|nr:cell death activator CIDE-A-like [Archocentrus centrarchus]
MALLTIQSGVKYAKMLLQETLMRSMSTVQTTTSCQILPLTQPRCFRVCNYSRRRRRSLVASSLAELLEQAARVFMLSCQFLILVLEEDGTVVDSEEFFHSLPNNTLLMVLENGDMWTKGKIIPCFRQPKRNRIAKLTFDLYKLQPKDLLCCFTIRGTLYETYTLSYDFRFTRIKHLLDSLLRCVTSLKRLAGQLLLCTSSS